MIDAPQLPATSANAPPAQPSAVPFLAPPPLIEGENAAAYDERSRSFRAR
jgi:hypothetical protein